jgi:peptidyl-tRNA hydrolase, PTH1 family
MRETLRRLFRRRSLNYDRLEQVVIGLGNPGRRYAATRHNVGWRVLQRIAEREGLEFRAGRGDFHAARWTRDKGDALLVLPSTFMNRSGLAARQLRELAGLGPDSALVVVDDLDLPLGKLRLRAKGSPGGHNGLASLSEAWETDRYPRLRLGIGRPQQGEVGTVEHVLSPFAEEELDTLEVMIEAAADAVSAVLDEGTERAMSRFNSLPSR